MIQDLCAMRDKHPDQACPLLAPESCTEMGFEEESGFPDRSGACLKTPSPWGDRCPHVGAGEGKRSEQAIPVQKHQYRHRIVSPQPNLLPGEKGL